MTPVSHGLEPARRVLVDHQGGGQGDRGGDGDREERDGNRTHEERQHAEMMGIGGPGRVGDEAESGLADGGESVVAEEDHRRRPAARAPARCCRPARR